MSDDEETEVEEIKLENDGQDEYSGVDRGDPSPTPVPTRSQQPRKAKAGAKRHWVDSSSDSEEDGDVSTDEGPVEAPSTPETVHEIEEHVKSAQGSEVQDDCIIVSSPIS